MNLHQIARGAINAINPFVKGIIYVNQHWTTRPDGVRVPSYRRPRAAMLQVQALSADELKQLDGLNIQGVKRAIYLNGRIDGVVRTAEHGGDLVVTPDGLQWLTVLVLEYWPDWCKVAVVQQLGVAPTLALTERILANGVYRATTTGAVRAIV